MAVSILQGHVLDRLAELPAASVHTVVTSPPYFAARDYKTAAQVWGGDPSHEHLWEQVFVASDKGSGGKSDKQVSNAGSFFGEEKAGRGFWCARCRCGAFRGDLGREPLHDCLAWARGEAPCAVCYVCHLRTIAAGLYRVLRNDGTFFLNIDDSMSGTGAGQKDTGKSTIAPSDWPQDRPATGLRPLNLCGVPARVALALQADGWYWRSQIFWLKRSPMCESVGGTRWEPCRVKVAAAAQTFNGYGGNSGNRTIPDASGGVVNAPRAEWAPCPGCPHCEATDGLRLRKGAGRPSEAYEVIHVFTKSPDYFWNQEALRRAVADYDRKGGTAPTTAGGSTTNGVGSGSLHSMSGAGGNIWNYWLLSPEPSREEHYAGFPTEVPRRCLLLGSPEKCCASCGAGWAPVVHRGELAGEAVIQDTERPAAEERGVSASSLLRTNGRTHREREVTGARPTCRCGTEETRPSVVLEPFLGTGTTVVVADRLGRDGIGIDLNANYTAIAERRLTHDAGMFADIATTPARAPSPQPDLFALECAPSCGGQE